MHRSKKREPSWCANAPYATRSCTLGSCYARTQGSDGEPNNRQA